MNIFLLFAFFFPDNCKIRGKNGRIFLQTPQAKRFFFLFPEFPARHLQIAFFLLAKSGDLPNRPKVPVKNAIIYDIT